MPARQRGADRVLHVASIDSGSGYEVGLYRWRGGSAEREPHMDLRTCKGAELLTNKGKYGLKAMVYLAGRPPGELALVSDIARENNISKKFLDAILSELRNAGLVQSRKGPGGGYALSRRPHEIMVGQIVRALDGPLAPIRCASQNYYQPCEDCNEENCSVRLMMFEVRNAISCVLDARSLAEMRALSDTDKDALMYYI